LVVAGNDDEPAAARTTSLAKGPNMPNFTVEHEAARRQVDGRE
jgi:hypothetical protein